MLKIKKSFAASSSWRSLEPAKPDNFWLFQCKSYLPRKAYKQRRFSLRGLAPAQNSLESFLHYLDFILLHPSYQRKFSKVSSYHVYRDSWSRSLLPYEGFRDFIKYYSHGMADVKRWIFSACRDFDDQVAFGYFFFFTSR